MGSPSFDRDGHEECGNHQVRLPSTRVLHFGL